MAKKAETKEEAKPSFKLPTDPKMLGILVVVIIIIIAAFAMRGGKKYEAPPAPTGGEEETPAVTTTSGPAIESCAVNLDCRDTDPCTTDSCTEGICKHVQTPSCAQTTFSKPKITAVSGFGDRNSEYVELTGTWDNIGGWYITNGKGNLLLTFEPNKRISGALRVYTGCELSTTTKLYTCNNTAVFSDAGDKAILRDSSGNIVSEKLG